MAGVSGILPAGFLIFIVYSIQLIDGHNVPVFMWSSKSCPSFSALSALSHVTSEQFSNDYLKGIQSSCDHQASDKHPDHKVPIVVFVQDRLSLEDMTIHGNGLTPQGQNFKHLQAHMDQNPSLVLPSVEDPFPVLRNVKGHQSIDTLNYNDDVRHKLAGIRSGINLVNLPATVGVDNRQEALKANDELMHKAVKHFESESKKTVFILIGKEPSWDASSEEASHRRIARSLLEFATDNETYTFAIHSDWARAKILDPNGQYNISSQNLTWPPQMNGNKNENGTLLVTLKFDTSSTEFKNLQLLFKFDKTSSYWRTSSMFAQFETSALSSQNVEVKANYNITASNGFSFSCGNTILTAKDNYTLQVTFHNFQVDPFSKMNASITNATFPESFHCSTFFTLPIWMGFFTILLFTVILGIGIFMLFEVKTMDRFDDPKGKTITVPQSE